LHQFHQAHNSRESPVRLNSGCASIQRRIRSTSSGRMSRP
jgi:hypothetical protein